MPLRALEQSLFVRPEGGRTHTRQPKVQKLVKFSRLPVARVMGDKEEPLDGNAFVVQSAWKKA